MKKITFLLMSLVMGGMSLHAQNESENNNTSAAANPFTASTTAALNIAGSITTSDLDWFAITLPEAGTWTFNLTNNSSPQGRVNVAIDADPSNTAFTVNQDFDFTQVGLQPIYFNCGGLVYVRLDQETGANIASYTLTVSKIPDSAEAFEPNNSAPDAQPISLNGTFQTYLRGYDCLGNADVDWYSVTTVEAGVLVFQAQGLGVGQRFRIRTYNNAGALVWDTLGATNQNVASNILLEANQTYTILLSDWTNTLSNNTQHTIITSFQPNQGEANNTFETAYPVAVTPNVQTTFSAKLFGNNKLISDGSSFSGADIDYDQDWYKVTAPSSGVLKIGVESVATGQRIQIYVFDQAFNQIGYTLGATSQSAYLNAIQCSGDFYIRIKDYYNDNEYDDPYELKLTFDTTDTCECNNRREDACTKTFPANFQAKMLGVSSTVSDGSNLSGYDQDEDQDWYKVTVPACGILTTSLSAIATNQRLRIEYFTATGSTPFSSQLGATSQSVSLSQLVPAGDYYIRIEDYYGNEYDSFYNVAISFSENPTVTQTGNTYSTFQTTGNTYQWYRDGQLINNATNYTYTSSIPGVYTVCISNASNGCTICTNVLAADTFDGILQMAIVPNPAQTEINLRLPQGRRVEHLRVIDLSGKVVIEHAGSDNAIKIDHLANGLYLLEAVSGQEKFIGKFIKE